MFPARFRVTAAPNSARSTELLPIRRVPAPSSCHSLGCCAGLVASGSTVRMRQNATAEHTNETASTSSTNGALISCTNTPPSGGPAISAIESLTANLLLPSSSCSRAISVGRNAG